MKKNIILIDESDERHDAEENYDVHIAKAPEDIKELLVKLDSDCVPWYRGKEFRAICLDKIIELSKGSSEEKRRRTKTANKKRKSSESPA